MLTSADKQLITALQIAPRASWSDIGSVLGISGVTAARRWSRITSQGLAWVTASPGMTNSSEQLVAFVEVDCTLTEATTVAAEIAQHELALTAELSTGMSNIILTVAAPNLAALSHYLLDHLPLTPGVLRVRARIATAIYSEGSNWLIAALPTAATRRLESIAAESTRAVNADPITMSDDLQRIAELLSIDGRMSYVELAERSGLSHTTVRRHVRQLIESGSMIPRTDVATELSGYPVQVYLWADAPVEQLPSTANKITGLRNVRLCATVASAPALLICAWLQTVEEIHRFEQTIARELPDVQIIDRLVVLRTVKRMGRIVDPQGRAVRADPIQIWSFTENHQDHDDALPDHGARPVA